MILLNILGGVALIVFGIRFLRKGLQRLFGQKLQITLERTTRYRLRAFFGGMAVAALVPSSTGIAIMTVQLMNAAQIAANRMLSIILGANIGTTAAVQLIAFNMDRYVPLFILLGVVIYHFKRNNIIRGIGQCILALGIIFLGISMISDGASLIEPNGDFANIVSIIEKHPWWLTLAACVLTLIMQSTTATIGLGIGFSLTGGQLVSLQTLVPIVLGADLGIAFTYLFIAWSSLEGRRLGAVNLLFKASLVIICLLFMNTLIEWINHWPGGLARQTANLHTAFNIGVAIIGLSLTAPAYWLFSRIISKNDQNHLGASVSFLNPKALNTPWLAMTNATRETLAMADSVKKLLESYWAAFQVKDIALAKQVQKEDDRIDDMNRSLKLYLSQINEEDLDSYNSKLQLALLNFSGELEAVSDIIAKNLCDILIRHHTDLNFNHEEDTKDLTTLYEMVTDRLETAISILATRDVQTAIKFLDGKEQLDSWCRESEIRHYQRLKLDENPKLDASSYYLDTMNNLRKINSHLTSIGYAFTKPVKSDA